MLNAAMKIRTRVYFGFLSLIVLGLAAAAVGWWGAGAISNEAAKMDVMSARSRLVLGASRDLERVGRIMLAARSGEFDASLVERLRTVQGSLRDAVIKVREVSPSALRRQLYESILANLDKQAEAADRQFAMGRVMMDGRRKLFVVGDVLTAALDKLVQTAREQQSPEVAAAAIALERDALLVRVAIWRTLATRDPDGPATFKTSFDHALASLETMQKLNVPALVSLTGPVRQALKDDRDAFDLTAPALIGLTRIFSEEQRPLIETMLADLGKVAESMTQDISDASAASASVEATVRSIQLVVAGLVLVGGLILASTIGRGIVRPISAMTSTMGTLAGGDYQIEIPGAERHDEIGEMARAVKVFKDNLLESTRLAAEQESERALRARRQDAMDGHSQSFGTAVSGVMTALGAAAERMRQAADAMAESARGMHQQATETARGAGKSSADLASVAAAVEQFSASAAEISRQVTVASAVSAEAVQRAEASQVTIRGLADSTARIGDVVRLIDSIAGQTNLLALNATIEAARAGDAGKGFAVVAGEVKALASQTARATAEISAQIETVRGATNDTIGTMNDISAIITRLGEVSTAISAAVEEQSATTQEIASSVQGVAASTAETAAAMERVVGAAERSGTSSGNIISEATQVGSVAGQLREEVAQFLDKLRNDSGERRRSERLTGGGIKAVLRIPGSGTVDAVLKDISKSGLALRCSAAVAPDREVAVELANAGAAITGRVSRVEAGVIAIQFDELASNLVPVERMLAQLAGTRAAA